MRAVGIDMGYRNLAHCEIGPENQPKWTNENIIPNVKEPSRKQLFNAIWNWCQRNKLMLDTATVIVLEVQKSKKFQNMNTVIMTLYPHKWVLVHPFTLCKLYSLPKKRAEKKAATVAYIGKRMQVDLSRIGYKVDDLADAALMAYYALDHLKKEEENEISVKK